MDSSLLNFDDLVAWTLLLGSGGTAFVMIRTLQSSKFQGRRVSIIAGLIPVTAWGLFYLTVLTGQFRLDFLVGFSRWAVVFTFAAFLFQAWAIRRSERP